MVPKPLKFLMKYYDQLCKVECTGDDYKLLQDILSFIAMTLNDLSLFHRIKGGYLNIKEWGHEYVKHISGNCILYYEGKDVGIVDEQQVIKIVNVIVPYFLVNNAEIDAIDLLIEMDAITNLLDHAPNDPLIIQRIGLYLIKMAPLLPPPQDKSVLTVLYKLYLPHDLSMSLIMAIKCRNIEFINHCFSVASPLVQQQLAFIIARDPFYTHPDHTHILSNLHLNKYFLEFVKNLNLLEHKQPNDIYKSHLESRTILPGLSHQLATAITNGFLNIGYCTKADISATDMTLLLQIASIGSINQWNPDALNLIDEYMYNENEFMSSGALLAIGLSTCKIRHPSDPTLALCQDQLTNSSLLVRSSALMALGISYCGQHHQAAIECCLPFLMDPSVDPKCVDMAAISLGLICVGSMHSQVTEALLNLAMTTKSQWIVLALGLILLQQSSDADVVLEALPHPLLIGCAYCNTGNILKVQQVLAMTTSDSVDSTTAHYVPLAIALMSTNTTMAVRMLQRMDNPTVPLALALLHVGNPNTTLLDALNKYSHSNDHQTATNAIFALGLVGCGTNNAKCAQLLRYLALYYYKDNDLLFMIRVAQGMIHMGKGVVGVLPTFMEHLTSLTSIGGILATITSVMDSVQLKEAPFLMYFLNCAAVPKYCLTLDNELNSIHTSMRIGMGVDVVGQAGKSRKITGFQTIESPLVMNYGERVELVNDKCTMYLYRQEFNECYGGIVYCRTREINLIFKFEFIFNMTSMILMS